MAWYFYRLKKFTKIKVYASFWVGQDGNGRQDQGMRLRYLINVIFTQFSLEAIVVSKRIPYLY